VSRSSVLLLEDIKKSCERIVRYTAGLTRDQVFVDEMRFDSVLSLDLDILWDAIQRDVPALLSRVQVIITQESAEAH
jgi:uncharacterized protein with HEPN domain